MTPDEALRAIADTLDHWEGVGSAIVTTEAIRKILNEVQHDET